MGKKMDRSEKKGRKEGRKMEDCFQSKILGHLE